MISQTSAPGSNTGAKIPKENLHHCPRPVLEQLGLLDRQAIFFTAPRPIHSPDRHLNGELLIDWLTVTCRDFSLLPRIRHDLETKFFATDFIDTGRGKDFYSNCLKNELGVLILYSKEGDKNEFHFTVKVPGNALKRLTQQKLIELLRYFYVKDFTCSRIDVGLDLFTLPKQFASTERFLRRIKTLLSTKTSKGLKLVTGVKKWKDASVNPIGQDKVQSLYLGSRQSEFMLRIYDKAVEQGLDKLSQLLTVDCPTWLRFEAELTGNLAQKAFEDLVLGCNEDPLVQHEKIKKVCLGAINRVQFWDRTSKNLERCQLVNWWQLIIDSVEKFKLTTAKPKPTIQKSIAWISKQVAPWYAAIALAIEGVNGANWEALQMEWISDGIKRLKDKHLLAVNEFLLISENVPA